MNPWKNFILRSQFSLLHSFMAVNKDDQNLENSRKSCILLEGGVSFDDIMFFQSLTLAGAVLAAFLITLICSKKSISRTEQLLVVWLAVVCLQLIFYYDNLSGNPVIPQHLRWLLFALPLLSSGILYLYARSIAFQLHRFGLFSAIPYLLYCILALYLQIVYGIIDVKKGIPLFSDSIPAIFTQLLTWPLALVPAFFSIMSLRILHLYRKILPEQFSYTERINLNWLRGVVVSYILLFVVLFILIRYKLVYRISLETLFAVVGTYMSGYVFFVGYFGLRQTTLLADQPVVPLNDPQKAAYANTGLNEPMADKLYEKLLLYMDSEKPYLEEDLSLGGLAQQLNVSTNHLSQVINQKGETSFFNFVNRYRVVEMQQKLKDPSFAHYSILAIGIHCGFKSKSSMNKIFKDMTGTTPSVYQKS